MGRSGNIGYGISNYFELPKRKKALLTKSFLEDFKNELIKLDKEYNKKRGFDFIKDYEKESYMSFYGEVEGTCLFYNALENVCKKHNLTKAIYEYARNMPWYDSDCFDDDLVKEMVTKGVIAYDSDEEYIYEDDVEEDELKYKLVKRFKGYNVVEYGNRSKDSKEFLEELYKDSEYELIWLN